MIIFSIPICVYSHSFPFPFLRWSLILIPMGLPWNSLSHWEDNPHVISTTCDRPLRRCVNLPRRRLLLERAYRCSAPAVWNSLPRTVVISDSVAVLKSRLKTFLFSRAFSSSLFSATHCLAPAPLKLRPYGAIQMRLLLLLLL